MSDATTPLRNPVFMKAFLDLMIPASADGKMPSAGALDLAASLAETLETDIRLGPLVQAGLQAVDAESKTRDPGGLPALTAEEGGEVVQSQLADHPALMLGMSMHLYTAYYQHPRVLEGLGEPPRPPFPEGYVVEETDIELLEALERRRKS